MKYDVVIMGGGTSATFAALRLKEAGASVVMVSDSKPSASMGCGELFSGAASGTPAPPGEFTGKLLEVLHTHVQKTDSYLKVNGSCLEARFAPSSALGLSMAAGKTLTLASLPGVCDYPFETSVARALKESAAEVRIINVRLQTSIEDFYLSPMQWAARFDEPRCREELLEKISLQARENSQGAVIFPPLLGICSHLDVMRTLSGEIAAPVYELLGVPGWPPGLRICNFVEEAVSKNGIEKIGERVASAEKGKGGDIARIFTGSGRSMEGSFFILATGGLIGGGLVFDRTLREPIFDLPVFMNEKRVGDRLPGEAAPTDRLWSEEIQGVAAAAAAGVRVDSQGRPIDDHGRHVFRNLRACGSVVEWTGERLKGSPVDPGWSALAGWETAGKLLKAL